MENETNIKKKMKVPESSEVPEIMSLQKIIARKRKLKRMAMQNTGLVAEFQEL